MRRRSSPTLSSPPTCRGDPRWESGSLDSSDIEPGSPWENGYVESFNGKLRDELLDREVFSTLKEVVVLTEDWRQIYNRIRPHSALGYRTPVPEAILLGASNDSLPSPGAVGTRT